VVCAEELASGWCWGGGRWGVWEVVCCLFLFFLFFLPFLPFLGGGVFCWADWVALGGCEE
jgi:hypothetical protein